MRCWRTTCLDNNLRPLPKHRRKALRLIRRDLAQQARSAEVTLCQITWLWPVGDRPQRFQLFRGYPTAISPSTQPQGRGQQTTQRSDDRHRERSRAHWRSIQRCKAHRSWRIERCADRTVALERRSGQCHPANTSRSGRFPRRCRRSDSWRPGCCREPAPESSSCSGVRSGHPATCRFRDRSP